MAQLVLLNKPYGVVCQFSGEECPTLADYIDIPGVYAAGRLDKDSEGLLLLTDDGRLQHQIAHPKHKQNKIYWVQLEGHIHDSALQKLRQGVMLKDGITKPAQAELMAEPVIWPRNPPVRFRKNIPTSWIQLTLREGRNRQVRRMTAAVGFPTLRLIRQSIGQWQLGELQPGEYRHIQLDKRTYKA